MLVREPYIYAALRHLVITYLTPKDRKLPTPILNGKGMQAHEYKLRSENLPYTYFGE
jgi:hypothetical protein